MSRVTDAVTSVDLSFTSQTIVSIAYRAATNTVYLGSGSNGEVYSLNLTTGTSSTVATLGGVISVNGLAIAPTTAGAIAGQLCTATYGGSSGQVCVDLSTSAQTTLATVSIASAIVFSQAGDAYIADYGGSQIVRVSPGQAPAQLAAGINGPDGLAIDEGRARLYVAASGSKQLYYVPLASGSPVAFPARFAFNTGIWPSPIAFDGFDTILYAAEPGAPTTVRAFTVP